MRGKVDCTLEGVLLYTSLLEMCDPGNNDLSCVAEEFFRWIKWTLCLWHLSSYIQRALRKQQKNSKIKRVFKTPSPTTDSGLLYCLQTCHLNTILFKSLISLYIEIARFLRLPENWSLQCQVRVHLAPHTGWLFRRWIIKGKFKWKRRCDWNNQNKTARQNAMLPAAPGAFAAETIHVITIGRFDKKHFMKNSTLKAEELNTFFFFLSTMCLYLTHKTQYEITKVYHGLCLCQNCLPWMHQDLKVVVTCSHSKINFLKKQLLYF